MRILLFSPYCHPLAGAEAIVTAKLAIALLNAGFGVDVVSQGDIARFYPDAGNAFWSRLRDVLHPVDAGRGAASPLRWAVRAVRCARRLTRRAQCDVILSRATPQYGHLPALLLSSASRVPWVANWSDPMPPAKAPPPYGSGPGARVGALAGFAFDRVCRAASWHTFPGERLRGYFLRYRPDIGPKSSVVPHVALQGIVPAARRRETQFTVCCSGSMALRDPAPYLEAFGRFLGLPEVGGAARTVFAGNSLEGVRDAVRGRGLEGQVSVEGVGTYESLLERTRDADVALVVESRVEEGVFFPSKLVDIAQTGTPVLALSPKVGTVPDILGAHGGGIAVDGASPPEILAALARLHEAWREGQLDARYGSGRLLPLFSEDTVIGLYRRVFRGLEAAAR